MTCPLTFLHRTREFSYQYLLKKLMFRVFCNEVKLHFPSFLTSYFSLRRRFSSNNSSGGDDLKC